MIDTLGLPVSLAHTCKTCASWRGMQKGGAAVCNDCGDQIPQYENVPSGYQAASIDHWHNLGEKGFRVVKKVLCRECYLKDYKKAFGVRLKMV
jgi:hypothetical protein